MRTCIHCGEGVSDEDIDCPECGQLTADWQFKRKFDSYVCAGDSITVKVGKLTITAIVERDDDMGEPWKEHDGHGAVSDWTSRGKKPGEVVLCSDRRSYRYYDWEESIKIAKRDGWDAEPYGGTKGQKAERAVKADFEAMKAWCDDEWFWCYIHLSVSKDDIELDDYAACLGGIEANYPGSDNAYLTEVANELLPEAIKAGQAALERMILKLRS